MILTGLYKLDLLTNERITRATDEEITTYLKDINTMMYLHKAEPNTLQKYINLKWRIHTIRERT